mgnify:CR=1 FL=1
MSWKLAALSIALFLGSAINLMAKEAYRTNSSSSLTSIGNRMVAAAKPTDKELIEQQKTCPVTDQPLGSMGKPVKVVVKGRTVFLCCAGCKKKLLADPEKFFKKLDEKK